MPLSSPVLRGIEVIDMPLDEALRTAPQSKQRWNRTFAFFDRPLTNTYSGSGLRHLYQLEKRLLERVLKMRTPAGVRTYVGPRMDGGDADERTFIEMTGGAGVAVDVGVGTLVYVLNMLEGVHTVSSCSTIHQDAVMCDAQVTFTTDDTQVALRIGDLVGCDHFNGDLVDRYVTVDADRVRPMKVFNVFADAWVGQKRGMQTGPPDDERRLKQLAMLSLKIYEACAGGKYPELRFRDCVIADVGTGRKRSDARRGLSAAAAAAAAKQRGAEQKAPLNPGKAPQVASPARKATTTMRSIVDDRKVATKSSREKDKEKTRGVLSTSPQKKKKKAPVAQLPLPSKDKKSRAAAAAPEAGKSRGVVKVTNKASAAAAKGSKAAAGLSATKLSAAKLSAAANKSLQRKRKASEAAQPHGLTPTKRPRAEATDAAAAAAAAKLAVRKVTPLKPAKSRAKSPAKSSQGTPVLLKSEKDDGEGTWSWAEFEAHVKEQKFMILERPSTGDWYYGNVRRLVRKNDNRARTIPKTDRAGAGFGQLTALCHYQGYNDEEDSMVPFISSRMVKWGKGTGKSLFKYMVDAAWNVRAKAQLPPTPLG